MRLPRPLRSPHPLANCLAFLLVSFLVLFPKGGLKIGGAPLTWGYLFIALSVPLLSIVWITRLPARVSLVSLLSLAALLPFLLVYLYSAFVNGLGDINYGLSTAVNFFLLPIPFLLLYPPFLSRVDPIAFRRWFCTAIFAAAVWGLFLFVLWPLTGHLLEIPLLTVNLADYGLVETTKHNARGPFLKLISTYNNGNVYGVATLILLPLYTTLEHRRWRRWVVRFALLLTLARTVWAGLLAEQILSLLPPLVANLRTVPTVRLRGAARQLLFVGATGAIILVVLFTSSYSLAFLLDPTLGGRIGEIGITSHATLLPSVPIIAFSEVLFASALTLFGYLGLAAFLLIFAVPFLFVLARPTVLADPIRRAAFKGLVLYVIVSLSDGAANLIPVIAFFWFTESVLLFGLPGAPATVALPALPRQQHCQPPSQVLPSTQRPLPGLLPGRS